VRQGEPRERPRSISGRKATAAEIIGFKPSLLASAFLSDKKISGDEKIENTVVIQRNGNAHSGFPGRGYWAGGGSGGAAACSRRTLVFRPAGRSRKILVVGISSGSCWVFLERDGHETRNVGTERLIQEKEKRREGREGRIGFIIFSLQ
jgi:hypothetical protein